MTSADQLKVVADAIDAARRECRTIPKLRETWPSLDDSDGYAIQTINTERRIAAGSRIIGRKIGLTSLAVQKQLGVDQPDYGVLFAEDVYGDNEPISLERFIHPKAEAEIGIVLSKDLDMPNPCWPDIVGAIAYVLPAIEIVDSVIDNWAIGFLDTVADNASGAALVLGGPIRSPEGCDLAAMTMQMHLNGEPASKGAGTDCLGHPINACVWLARKLRELGQPLRAGDLILTGALGPMVPVTGPSKVEASISGLGTVRAVFQEGAV